MGEGLEPYRSDIRKCGAPLSLSDCGQAATIIERIMTDCRQARRIESHAGEGRTAQEGLIFNGPDRSERDGSKAGTLLESVIGDGTDLAK